MCIAKDYSRGEEYIERYGGHDGRRGHQFSPLRLFHPENIPWCYDRYSHFGHRDFLIGLDWSYVPVSSTTFLGAGISLIFMSFLVR